MPSHKRGGGSSMDDRAYFAFLRHGDYAQRPATPSARQPFALTRKGVEQARLGLATLIRQLDMFAMAPAPQIHASRQLRAWQTAHELMAGLRGQGYEIDGIVEDSRLAERGLGSAANLTISEIESVLAADPRFGPPPPGWKSDSDYCLPLEGAESLSQAGQRVASYLQEVIRPGVLTVFVGHGASFRHACQHLGLLRPEEVARFSMYHAEPLLFCHEGRDSWRHLAGEWKIRAPKEVAID